jgi:hypothetical protein
VGVWQWPARRVRVQGAALGGGGCAAERHAPAAPAFCKHARRVTYRDRRGQENLPSTLRRRVPLLRNYTGIGKS